MPDLQMRQKESIQPKNLRTYVKYYKGSLVRANEKFLYMNSNTIMDSITQPHYGFLLSHIIDDNTYLTVDPVCIEIGKAFLATIVRAISLLIFRINYQRQTQSTKILKRCVTYLTGCQEEAQVMSRCNKIWMYLGEMFNCRQFNHLQIFQQELTAIIQAISIQQPSPDQSAICFANEGSMQDISMIETINLIEQDSPPSPLAPAESNITLNWGQQVDEYLGKIKSYRSEINHLCQMMKLPQINISVQRQERYYQIKCSISFECIYLNKKAIYLQGTSIHSHYQESLQSSCLKLLRRIYITVPQLWKDFVKLKQKKAIIT